MSDNVKMPEILVFAGPNGSGKSTITQYIDVKGKYVNADDIKRSNNIGDLEAAQLAEKIREECIQNGETFTFETVLSTDRNMNLLKRAKEAGYFIRCIYVLTKSPEMNVARVKARVSQGGHGVPSDKIKSRYYKCMDLLPELIKTCDIIHIYDNTEMPVRIFKKGNHSNFHYFKSDLWEKEDIKKLTDGY